METGEPDRPRARLSADTTRDIEERQADGWRRMSSLDVARTLNAAWTAGSQLAWFGLKDRFPTASDEELRVRLAVLTLGADLARRIHPNAGDFLDA
jgi:hypothetical protein